MNDPLLSKLDADLRRAAGDTAVRSAKQGRWLLIGDSAGRTVEVDCGGGVARLYAGRIVHALSAENTDEIEHVVDVALAIQRGHAAELFGIDSRGVLTALGYEITGDGFSYQALDEDVRVIARVAV